MECALWMPPLMLYEQKNGCLVIWHHTCSIVYASVKPMEELICHDYHLAGQIDSETLILS
jgi:hypothetical protein